MLTLLRRFRTQLTWILGTVVLTGVWLAFIHFVQPNEIGLLATAFATACLIALIQNHYKKRN